MNKNTNTNMYPGSMPEFRFLQKGTGEKLLQVRYVEHQIGYIGKWQDIPTEFETNNQGIINGHNSHA